MERDVERDTVKINFLSFSWVKNKDTSGYILDIEQKALAFFFSSMIFTIKNGLDIESIESNLSFLKFSDDMNSRLD